MSGGGERSTGSSLGIGKYVYLLVEKEYVTWSYINVLIYN